MPELEDIVQRVAISGQDDVIQALGEIGHVGQEAFRRVAESLGKVGELAAGFTIGVGGVGAALFEWAKHSSEAVKELRNLSGQMGATVQQASSLQGALISMGGSADDLSNAFRRAAFNIEREWEAIKKSTASARDQLISDANAVASAEIAARKAKQAREEAFGVRTARPDDQFLKQKEAQIAESEATVKLSEARRKADDDRRNSLAATIPAIQSVTKGLQTLTEAGKTAEISTENVFKALIATSTAETADAIKNFNGDINSLAGMTPKVREFFYNLADFMKNAHDATLEQALAVRVFGRGIGQDLIYPLKQGSEAIQAHEEHLKHFGLVISNDALKPAEEFHHAYNSLTYDLSTTVKQIGLIFGPEFTEGMKQFTGFFEENHEVILEWARSIETEAKPIIKGFFDALSGFFASLTGAKVDPATEIGKWKQSFDEFGATVKTVVHDLVTALGLLKSALDGVRDSVNALFGTKLNSAETFLGGLIAWKLLGTGLGGALGEGIKTGVERLGLGAVLARGLAASFGGAWPALIGLAIAATFPQLREIIRNQLGQGADQKPTADQLKKGMHQDLTSPTGLENQPTESYDPKTGAITKASPSSARRVTIVRGTQPTDYNLDNTQSDGTVAIVRGTDRQNYNVAPGASDGRVGIVRNGQRQDYNVPAVATATEKAVTSTDENTVATKENTTALNAITVNKPFGEAKNPVSAEVAGANVVNKMFDNLFAAVKSAIAAMDLSQYVKNTNNEKAADALTASANRLSAAAEAIKESAKIPAHAAGGILGFGGGGKIVGPGGPKDDMVLMRGSPGEYVVKAEAVKHYGEGTLAAINSKAVPKFDAGGFIDSGFHRQGAEYKGQIKVGEGVEPAILDTGADTVVISEKMALESGIDLLKARKAKASTAGGTIDTLNMPLDVGVGGVNKKVAGRIVKESMPDALLGTSFLQSLADFGIGKSGMLIKAALGGLLPGYDDGGYVDSGFHPDKLGSFLGPATIGHAKVRALLDTGANTVAITHKTAEASEISLRDATPSKSGTAGGGVVDILTTGIPIIIGGIQKVVKGSVFPAGTLSTDLIGMSFLDQLSDFVVTKRNFLMRAAEGGSPSMMYMGSNGEYVLGKSAVSHYGKEFASSINDMSVPKSALEKFAQGGEILSRILGPGRAGGGVVSGPGSGTSDSILTPTSTGEYVVRADGGNLMSAIQHFAGGGMIGGMLDNAVPSSSVPFGRSAAESQTSTGHPVTLVIDGRKVEGITATPDAAKMLAAVAADRRMRSGGSKPDWFR